jgi:signal transduction histidine kinase
VHADLRPAPVSGEPVLLERMVGNLVDNAARYNRPGGHLKVSTVAEGARAVLRIANTGREIRPDEAQMLLEPFVHGGGGRFHTGVGLGLGLSIVLAVAYARHGRITLAPRSAAASTSASNSRRRRIGRPDYLASWADRRGRTPENGSIHDVAAPVTTPGRKTGLVLPDARGRLVRCLTLLARSRT